MRIHVLLLLLVFLAPALADTYPEGSKDKRVWDYAHVIHYDTDRKAVDEVVDKFNKDHPSGIWVVVLPNLAKYDSNPNEIANYAEWMLKDHLSSMGADDSSILFLISKDDRKARIELGRAWDHQWDAECDHIMQTMAVPNFRMGDYVQGIKATVRALNEMVTKKENTNPAILKLGHWGDKFVPYGLFGPVARVPALLLCLGLFLLGLKAKGADGKNSPSVAILGLLGTSVVMFGGGVYDYVTTPDGIEMVMFVGGISLVVAVIFLDFRYDIGICNFLFFNSGGNSWDSGWGSSSSGWSSGSSSFGSFGGGGGSWGGGGGSTGSW